MSEGHLRLIRHLAKPQICVYIHGVPRTRLSFYYLATYLLGAGIALVFAPSLALRLLFATGHYGDVMPRLLGVVLFALGIVIVQIIRHRPGSFCTSTLVLRVFLVLALARLLVS